MEILKIYNIPENYHVMKRVGVLGFVTSLVSFVCVFLSPVIGIVFGIAALVMCISGLRKGRSALAISGLTISVISIFLALIFFSLGWMTAYSIKNTISSQSDNLESIAINIR
jgi:hypothetical protein